MDRHSTIWMVASHFSNIRLHSPESDTKEMQTQIQRPQPNGSRVFGHDVILLTFVRSQRFATSD